MPVPLGPVLPQGSGTLGTLSLSSFYQGIKFLSTARANLNRDLTTEARKTLPSESFSLGRTSLKNLELKLWAIIAVQFL
jgi:hypothetical protein